MFIITQVTGSDEENYPLTRKVQRDIWYHQHPPNCRDPGVKFLVADWERLPGFGIGAQLAGMCGLLAIAINEKRVLVTNYYNRADHDGCEGWLTNGKIHWSLILSISSLICYPSILDCKYLLSKACANLFLRQTLLFRLRFKQLDVLPPMLNLK